MKVFADAYISLSPLTQKWVNILAFFLLAWLLARIAGILSRRVIRLGGTGKPQVQPGTAEDALWPGAGHHIRNILCDCRIAQSQPIRRNDHTGLDDRSVWRRLWAFRPSTHQ